MTLTQIFIIMILLIAGSWILERVLPQGVKDRLGASICWGMMAITMTFLGLSTVGLILVIVQNQILPLLAG